MINIIIIQESGIAHGRAENGRRGLAISPALFVPALEGEAWAGGGGGYGHSLVDVEVGVGRLARFVTVLAKGVFSSTGIVVVPDNERGRGLLFVLIDCPELHDINGRIHVRIRRIRGLEAYCRFVWRIGVIVAVPPAYHHRLGIILQNSELGTGKHGDASVLVGSAVPVLHHPMGEDLVGVGRGRSRSGSDFCIVGIETSVCRPGGTACHIIHHLDAYGTFHFGTPLAVQIEFLGDPETFGNTHSCVIHHRVGIPGSPIAELVHRVCEIRGFVIGGGHGGFVQLIDLRIEGQCAGGIQIPARKFIIVTDARRHTDQIAIRSTEVHGLCFGTPV